MKISYEQITDDVKVDSGTGEILAQNQTTEVRTIINKKIPNEPDYIKLYRYVNTLFAFKGIKTSLTPYIIEISNYMTYAKDGQIVSLNKYTKGLICENLGISNKRLEQVIKELTDCDILRRVDTGVYSVNPYIVARGSWADIRKLQTHYDFMTGDMTTIANVKDTITGQDIRKAISNSKGQIPGQLSLFDEPEVEEQQKLPQKPAPNNKFNNFPQNKIDFEEFERKMLDN